MNDNHNLIFNKQKIADTYNVRLVLHRPRPYTNNPLFPGTEYLDRQKLKELTTGKALLGNGKEGPFVDQHKIKPTSSLKGFDEWFAPSQFGGRAVYPASIVKSPLTGNYQMYYWVNGGLDFADSGWSGGSSVTCYAESKDGINWSMPNLKSIKIFGNIDNNAMFPPGSYPYIIIDKYETDENKRYKAYIHPGPRMAFSPDGINWSEQIKCTVTTSIGRSDGDTFFGWDELHKKYVAYLRPWKACQDEPENVHFSRKIGRAESDDLIHWTNHKCILKADDLDAPWAELERMLVFRYGDLYLGLLVVFNTVPEQRHAISHMIGSTYMELAWSVDGIEWNRFEERDPFLSYKPGVRDFGLTLSAHQCAEIDNELYFYYESTNSLHGQLPYVARLQLARLTKDRFAGYCADDVEGCITTKPMICPGGKLKVNADVTMGTLRAAVIESDGKHSLEHAVYRCNYIEGNDIEHNVRWINTDNLDFLKDKQISLRFYLRNAEIFSYWFE